MRVLVCGGRDFTDAAHLWRVLDEIDVVGHGIHTIIEGASDDVTGAYMGADYWANQWALARNKGTIRHHAEWKKLGKSAGPIRNQAMLDQHRPHLVIAFPGGRGTADMVRRANHAGVQVREI